MHVFLYVNKDLGFCEYNVGGQRGRYKIFVYVCSHTGEPFILRIESIKEKTHSTTRWDWGYQRIRFPL